MYSVAFKRIPRLQWGVEIKKRRPASAMAFFEKENRGPDFRMELGIRGQARFIRITSAGVGGVTGFQPPAGNQDPDFKLFP